MLQKAKDMLVVFKFDFGASSNTSTHNIDIFWAIYHYLANGWVSHQGVKRPKA
ncbi:hypothetical protein ARNL5_03863 [Anaerolineae bacterium]|nr:hypothetical protein ARNL5_03863 [Anaerolineae bacterium]